MNEAKNKVPQTATSNRNLQAPTMAPPSSSEIERAEFWAGKPALEILAVISDPKIRKNISRVTDEIGVRLTVASGLGEAREILERGRTSLVICSAHLDDGTFQELLSLAPRLFAGMIVLCSRKCSSGARIDALELGIMDYVSYPLSMEELQWVIRGAVHRILEGHGIPAASA